WDLSLPTTAPGGAAPRPAQPLTDLDFHSGARISELNQLVQELSKRTARDPGVRAAPELVVLKDFVFSLLGVVQQLDGRLPGANEYLLLSGGACQGTVDVDPGVLGRSAPGADYDADYTLLVPVLQAGGCPVTLDMRRCPPGHAWLPLAPFGPEACHRWADCCRHHGDEAYLAPGLVSAWFSQALGAVADRARGAPRRGGPAVERVAGRGGLVTLLLSQGAVRALYDVVPVVAFQGWPAAAREWLGRSHFWDGKLSEEDVAGGFYLLPGSGPASGLAWRLSFSRSELHLKRAVPPPLLRAHRAAMAALGGAWGGRVGPYHLWSLVLWACDRLPARYLGREENAAHCLLGLLDDMAAGLGAGAAPHYFLPGCDRLVGGAEPGLARAVAAVRGDPVGHLRRAVERVKMAAKLGRGPEVNPSPSALGGEWGLVVRAGGAGSQDSWVLSPVYSGGFGSI
uniref:Transmembrane protein 102 n=1 Tax=Chelydra serpentina TaxID=8475 RepID=A0A8C3SUW3_CHESE